MPLIMTPQGPVELPYGPEGGGAEGPGPVGPPGIGGPPSPGGPGGNSGSDILRQIIDLLRSYMDAERDDEDLAVGAKLIAQAQALLAKQQKERDAAMGAGPAAKMLRRGL